ncbi:MAG: TolC family protein [bacterium]
MRVIELNLELKAGACKTAAAINRTKQAARRINPRLEGGIENVAGTGDFKGFRVAESTIAFSQEIELGNKRRHRTTAAETGVAVSRELETARLSELLLDVRRAVLKVLAVQAKVTLAEETLALVRETEAIARSHELAGKTTPLETGRASTETARAVLALQDRQAEQKDAIRELALCWGETEPTFDAVAGLLDTQTAKLPALSTLLIQAKSNPLLLVADAQTRAFEAKIRTEEAERLPNLEIAAGVRRFEEADGFGFVAGVGIDLPLFNRNRDAVRAAAADAESARLEAAAIRLKNESTLRRLHARLKTLSEKNASLRDTIIPASESTLAFVKQSHEQGKAGYLDVLDARRTVVETRMDVINASVEYHACQIEIDQICSSSPATP